jgi:hypothetical protein
MSQIRAIMIRLRATIVLVAVAAVFGGALLSSPAAHATPAAFGLSAPCDYHSAMAGKSGSPVNRAGSNGHCTECCLFGGVGVLALPVRASVVIPAPAESGSLSFDVVAVDGATELLLSGAANGARAPPVAI